MESREIQDQTVTDGPFHETKEVIGGYWIIEVNSKEEAVEWASQCPASDNEVIEIRQIQEFSDFPADVRAVVASALPETQGARPAEVIEEVGPAVTGWTAGVRVYGRIDTRTGGGRWWTRARKGHVHGRVVVTLP